MWIIGCDFHPSFQVIAFLNTETGETGERRLNHPQQAEQYYRALAGQKVRIGMEATGNFRWFRRLLHQLGLELQLGDATRIRTLAPRKQHTDRRDAAHILKLLVEERFPIVWQPLPAEEDARQLLLHRCRLVQLRTRVKNQLDSVAKNEGLAGARAGTEKGRARLRALPLTGWYQQRRDDLLQLLAQLDAQIAPLDRAMQTAATQRAEVALLMTHPGVGPNVALAFVLALGSWERFPRGRHVASYLGLVPAEESSGQHRRLGRITKQGNALVRWLLVEAASRAQRWDPSWHRQYLRLAVSKHHGVGKVAIARKLAVRLYWMWRSGQSYEQVQERGSHAGPSV